jgi:hypothetical protein
MAQSLLEMRAEDGVVWTDGDDFYQKTSYEDPAAIRLIRAAW